MRKSTSLVTDADGNQHEVIDNIEFHGRRYAMEQLMTKKFAVRESRAGGTRNAYHVRFYNDSDEKLVIVSSTSADKKEWMSGFEHKWVAKYVFAYVLVHWQTGDIHIIPGSDYRKQISWQMDERGKEDLDKYVHTEYFIRDDENKYRDNWKILRN